MSEESKQLMLLLETCADKFNEINISNGNLLDFHRECHFASQQITKSDFTFKVARQNQPSLRNAIVNCSAVGLSLNPANAHAYLVPRKGNICLDISYKGLIKLATDSGSIKWAKAVLVHKEDTFIYNGPAVAPEHHADVFAEDRGEVKGGYCIAKTSDGDFLIETMSIKDIHEVRATSQAFTSGNTCPWKTFPDEMAKKTLIKRASKTWPQTDQRQRLDKAIEVINQHEGLKPELLSYDSTSHTEQEKEQLHKAMTDNNAMSVYCLFLEVGENSYTSLYHSFEKGTKGKNQQVMDALHTKGQIIFQECVALLNEAHQNEDEGAAIELMDELLPYEDKQLREAIDPLAASWLMNINGETA